MICSRVAAGTSSCNQPLISSRTVRLSNLAPWSFIWEGSNKTHMWLRLTYSASLVRLAFFSIFPFLKTKQKNDVSLRLMAYVASRKAFLRGIHSKNRKMHFKFWTIKLLKRLQELQKKKKDLRATCDPGMENIAQYSSTSTLCHSPIRSTKSSFLSFLSRLQLTIASPTQRQNLGG